MSGEDKKQPEQVEKVEPAVNREEIDKLKAQLEEQAKKMKEYEAQMAARSEEYKFAMEQLDVTGAGLKGYKPLGSEANTPENADDFMTRVIEDARRFEEIYKMPKRYNLEDPFQSLICRMTIDIEQGIPWEHVKKLYSDEMKKYNIVV